MRIPLFRPLLLATTMLLGACGDDDAGRSGGQANSPGASTVSSSAVKGVIHNGVVTARRWHDGQWSDVATALTREDGSFSLPLGSATPGILRIDLSAAGDGVQTRMRCDAPAGCGDAVFGDWQPLDDVPQLRTWAEVDAAGNVVVMPLTPLSTMVVRYAESLDGMPEAAAFAFARQRLAQVLGVSPDALMARPGDITSPTFVAAASPDQLRISLLSAAFAQVAPGMELQAVVDAFASAFADSNGRLLQEGGSGASLAVLLEAAVQVGVHVGVDATRLQSNDWLDRLAVLNADEFTTLPAARFDSAAFLTGLGALGEDVQRVIRDSGAIGLEHLVAKELSEFGWLLGQDTPAVAQVVMQSVLYSLMGAVYLDVLPAAYAEFPLVSGELNAVLKRKTETLPDRLEITGTHLGLQVNVTIDLTSFRRGAADKRFVYRAVGSVTSDRIDAGINGSLVISSHETDLAPLLAAIDQIAGGSGDLSALAAALAGMLENGHGTFAIDGQAGIENLSNGSRLAVSGSASAELDMDGAAEGGMLVEGGVAHGQLTLPNGDTFRIQEGTDQHLTFSLDENGDGSLSARFLANVLTVPEARVFATGSLTRAGKLASHVRDQLVGVLNQAAEGAAIDLGSALAAILAFDFSGMHLEVDGQAVVDGWSKTYRMAIRDGDLRIYQPNSTTSVALGLNIGAHGVFIQTPAQYWLIGLDLGGMALVVSDSDGGESRYDLGALLGYVALR